MNFINRPTYNFKFLKWREDNVSFLLEQYIPFLLTKLNSKYSKVLTYSFKLPNKNTNLEGFLSSNVTLLIIKLETLKGVFDITLRIPIPNQQDLFIINKNVYILVNQLEEHTFYFYNGDIKSQKFVIYSKDGLWQAHVGSQVRKNTKSRPVFLILWALDLLNEFFPTVEIVSKKEADFKNKRVHQIGDTKKYIQFDKDLQITPVIRLALTSLRHITAINNTERIETLSFLEKNNPVTFYHEFKEGYSDITSLYRDIFTKYNNTEYHLYNEIHGAFARVSYYHQVIRPLEVKIASIKNIFDKARNLVNDISWHQKIPDKFLKNFIIHKGLQYLDPNIFKEIDFKYKLTYFIDNVPTYLREPRLSLIKHIDFVASPDNKNIGVVQQLTYDCELDEYGYFKF